MGADNTLHADVRLCLCVERTTGTINIKVTVTVLTGNTRHADVCVCVWNELQVC